MTPMSTPLGEFQVNENNFNNQLSAATHQRQQNNDLSTKKNFLDSSQLHCLNLNLLDLQTNKSKQSDSIESLITNKILQKSTENSLLKLENSEQHFKLSDELQIKNDKISQHNTQQQQLYDLQKLSQQDQHYLIDLDQQNYKNLNECVKSTSNLIKNLINNNENKLKQDSEHCCTNNCVSNCKIKNKDIVNENDTLLMINSNLSLHKPLKSSSLIPFDNLIDETAHTLLVMPQQTISTTPISINNSKSNNYVPLTAFSSALALTNNLNSESNVSSSIFANCQQPIMSTSTTTNMQEEQTFHIKNENICNSTINNISPLTFVNSITNQNALNNRNNFSNNNLNFIDPFSSMHSQWLQSTDQAVISNSSTWFMPPQLAKHT